MKTYIFHVSVARTGRTWRKIEIRDNQTLHGLHLAIQDAFEFDNDHLYSFFMSGKAWDRRTEYRPPEGYHPWSVIPEVKTQEDDEPRTRAMITEEYVSNLFGDKLGELREKMTDAEWVDFLDQFAGPGDALTTKMEHLKLAPDQKFMYLFDYGDEWRFTIRVHAINPDAPDGEYPRIVESVGKAPPQYPEGEY